MENTEQHIELDEPEGLRTTNTHQQLFERMEEGFISAAIVRDGEGRIIDWRILEANAAIQKHIGVHSADLAGRLGSEVFPVEIEWWLHMVRHVITAQRSENIEQYFDTIDRWFEIIMFPFGPGRFAVLYHDITERRRRESSAVVLDCVTNEMAGLSQPDEIMQKVGELIGDYLKVSGFSFVDVDESSSEITISYRWQQEGTPSLRQTLPLDDFLSEANSRASRAGQTVSITDTGNNDLSAAGVYTRLRIGALVTTPFIWQGRWIASACICSISPRNWKEEEISFFKEVSNRLFPRMERARSEEVIRKSEKRLRESEEVKSFLLRLSDAVRPLADPDVIQETVTTICMDHFGADRCYYCEVIDGYNVIRRDAAREGFISVAGSYPHEKMPLFSAAISAGQTFVVGNVASSELIDDWQRKICLELRIVSLICVPVVKEGVLTGLLCIAQSWPREWTDAELNMAEDVAARTWSAVECAKAEQQLERELHDMRRLQGISNRLIDENDIQPLYDAILDSAVDIMQAAGANIQVFMPEKNELYMLAAKNFHPATVDRWRHIKQDLSSAYWQEMISGGRAIVPDMSRCRFEITAEDVDYFELSGIGAFQSTPLISRAGKHVGMLTTTWNMPHHPSDRDLSLVDVLARQAADLIGYHQALDVLREANRQLHILLKD